MRQTGMAVLSCPAALIPRDMQDDAVHLFRRDEGRASDHVIVPNPACHGMPDAHVIPAGSVEPAGWIPRSTVRRDGDLSAGIVVAIGGGTPKTRAVLYTLPGRLLRDAR
jgi:hypothetical protein